MELPSETTKEASTDEAMDELDPAEGYVGMVMGGFTCRAAAYWIHPLMLAPRRRLPIVHQPITFTMTDFEGVTPHDDDPIVVKFCSKHNVL